MAEKASGGVQSVERVFELLELITDAGGDVKPDGTGAVTEERLYQLVRQKGDVRDRTFRIEFLDAGVEAFAFTFG